MTPQNTGVKNTQALQQALVDQLVEKSSIKSSPVEAAFRGVPRHLFVPHVSPADAYVDNVITVKILDGKPVSSSSQPTMMAIMLEQLALKPGMRVLEIGAGSGYNAGLMAHMVGPTGHVVTIDIDEDLVQDAAAHLKTADINNVTVHCGDGAYGYPEYAPYDRIILTVAADDITAPWLSQLAPDGLIVMPIVLNSTQVSAVFRRDASGLLHSTSVTGCRFMVLRGDYAVDEPWHVFEHKSGLTVLAARTLDIDLKAIIRLLRGRAQRHTSSVQMDNADDKYAVLAWCSLYLPETVSLYTRGKLAQRKMIPYLFGDQRDFRMTSGQLMIDGMAVWSQNGGAGDDDLKPHTLDICSYGIQGQALAQRMLDTLYAWERAGRPGADDLQITVYPHTVTPPTTAGTIYIARRSVTLGVHYA